jgi:hypothetical protein
MGTPLKSLLISEREAFIIWSEMNGLSSALMARLFDIAFPLGTDDIIYKAWVKSKEAKP